MGSNQGAEQQADRLSRRYAFIVPRFGEGIAGGAETLVGQLASHLHRRGNSVEVLTTCAKDNRTWANELPVGQDEAYGMSIRRFPVDERDLEVWIPKQISISEGMNLSVEDQLDWMEHSVNSVGLYRYVQEHADSFDALFFAPYLFGTTFWGSLIKPERSYLIPCLHDEHYAYTDIIQSMFNQVAGALFNAIPEQELAGRLYGDIAGGEVGMGFEPLPVGYREQLTPYFDAEFPYVLYQGRKETMKNVPLLIDYFCEAKASVPELKDLKLVIAGGGSFDDLHRPQAIGRDDIVDVPQVSETDKHRLMRHATVLCQPSTNESFSIVLMEAWLLGTPVLVHADCAVTRYHVKASGGGLYFSSPTDFCGVMTALTTESGLRQELAEWGEKYTHEQYSWEAVLARFDKVMDGLLSINCSLHPTTHLS